MRWKATVVVPTYNAVQALDLVLTGLLRQSVSPFEILIPDDGSTEETRDLIESWRPRFACPLRHFHHEDAGFRKARIVNAAVLDAEGDYLCFLDGDCIPHKHWLKDHLISAKPNRVLCGRRVRLNEEISQKIDASWVNDGRLEGYRSELVKKRLGQNIGRGLRLPLWLAAMFRIRDRKLMGCNFSLPLDAMRAVNGYDEDFVDYGGEDYDLDLRLRNGGFQMTPLINRGCVFHLFHPMKRTTAELRALRERKKKQNRVRCENGLEEHAAV